MQKLATTELANLLEKDALRFAEPMSLHTSFQIGGPADIFTLPSSQAELMQILKFCYTHDIPWMIVGRGSNLLVSDKGIRGMVIATDLYNKISIDENYVSAFCGASLEDLCNFCRDNGVAGLEFASGIPGSVGGAVFMNAGAYGGEIKDVLYCSKALNPTLEGLNAANPILHIKYDEHQFGYRHSSFQDNGFIHLSSVFKLNYDDKDSIAQRMRDLHEERWCKQPMELPSGGSIFKRPPGHFTGKLIDDCGMRGYQLGGARISDKHCGFIVNAGGATAADVMALIKHAQDEVKRRYDVDLQTEIRKVGDW